MMQRQGIKSFVNTPFENKYNFDKLDAIEVPTKKLPIGSQGEVYPFDKIEISPMTFYDILYYSRNYNKNATDYIKLIYHLNTGRIKISNFAELFLPDAYYALLLMYMYSLSDEFEVKFDYVCTQCEEMNEDVFNSYEIKTIEYKGYEFYIHIPAQNEEGESGEKNEKKRDEIHTFKQPKVSEVIDKLPKLFNSTKRNYDLDTALLIISHQNYEVNPYVVEEYIANLTHHKAFVFMSALYLFNEPIKPIEKKCKHCGALNSINVMIKTFDEFFDLFLKNCSL